MNGIRELLRDRRRRQRGSVLSAVLIMTAFIAIISGALMTELSTNLLLSRTLVSRIAYQATENSVIEQSISGLQTTPLDAPCPALTATTLNGVSAAPRYLNCWPTIREETKVYAAGGSGSSFQVDGTQAHFNGFNDYVVGDAGGTVIDIPFGASAPRWALALGGQVTATPLVTPMPGSATKALDVVPLSGGACAPSANCVDVHLDAVGSSTAPSAVCAQPASSGAVTTQPAASPSTPGLVYYGDGTLLEAADVSTTEGSTCDFEASATLPNGDQVTGGQVAFRCSGGCGSTHDFVYAVSGTSSGSQVVRYAYTGSLNLVSALNLPWASATGLAFSSSTLPATLAITFAAGGVALVQIGSNGSMSLGATASAGGAVGDAPTWCHCPGGDQIGVAAQNGALTVFNSALQPLASVAAGSPIDTTPATDAAGNWYFGARDGLVHEVQLTGGTATQVDSFGTMGQIESAVQLAACSAGICIYAGALDDHVYLVPLDARRAIISACIATAPPACSGANPKLWASVEVGASGSPQTVHVEGWSYYSG